MAAPVRYLTDGEKSMLRQIFEITLPLDSMQVTRNDEEIGGPDNSITPGPIPFMAKTAWSTDYAYGSSASDEDRGNFIHECVHVWQFYHGITKLSAIKLYVWYRSDYYPEAYKYNLSDNDDFTDYNMEQMAAIIEDWWRILNHLSPQFNIGGDRSLDRYNHFVDQMRSVGMPVKPNIPPIPRFRR